MLARAISSSSSGARVTHCWRRCEITSASSPSIRQYAARSAASTPDGTSVGTPASGSANPVPYAQRLSSSWSVSASYASSKDIAASDVRNRVGDGVIRRVPIRLVATGREERVLVGRPGRHHVVGADHPDADPLV